MCHKKEVLIHQIKSKYKLKCALIFMKGAVKLNLLVVYSNSRLKFFQ